MLCVIDDAQWLDEESADLLSFVARRLLADRVGLLFAVRETADAEPRLQALPGLRICGLPEQAAYELLKTSISRPIDPPVAARIVAETGGNPLAVVEAARELTPEQLGGRMPLPEPLPVGHRLEASFLRRVRELPADTQALLLLAAAGLARSGAPPVAGGRRAGHPGVRRGAGGGRGAGGLLAPGAVRRTRSSARRSTTPQPRPSGAWPIARWRTRAIPSSTRFPGPGTSPRPPPGATKGSRPSWRRPRNGPGAAVATPRRRLLLECAAQLTPARRPAPSGSSPQPRPTCSRGPSTERTPCWSRPPEGLRNPLSAAQATRLRGRIQATCGRVAEAVAALVDAAERLRPLEPRAARDALLSALESAAFAGWATNEPLLDEIARIARNLPPTGDPPDSAANLLLRGYTARVDAAGTHASVPAMRDAVQAFLAEDLDTDVALRRLELVAIGAADLLDDAAVERLTTRWIDQARESGALARLAGGLAFRSAFVDAPSGRLAAAWTADAEARELGTVTRNPAIVPPTGAHRVITLALSGREAEARETAAAVAREAPSRGASG